MHSTAHIFHAVADQFLVNIQTDVVHSLHGGASLVVSESARSLSSAFLHQALLHDLFIQTIERSTTSLLLLQPLAMPQQSTSTSQASRFGGQVAGARSDQNSFLLDGGEITNPTSGNTDYWKAFSGSPEGSIPTPVESIQEFNVETNNPSGPLSLG